MCGRYKKEKKKNRQEELSVACGRYQKKRRIGVGFVLAVVVVAVVAWWMLL